MVADEIGNDKIIVHCITIENLAISKICGKRRPWTCEDLLRRLPDDKRHHDDSSAPLQFWIDTSTLFPIPKSEICLRRIPPPRDPKFRKSLHAYPWGRSGIRLPSLEEKPLASVYAQGMYLEDYWCTLGITQLNIFFQKFLYKSCNCSVGNGYLIIKKNR